MPFQSGSPKTAADPPRIPSGSPADPPRIPQDLKIAPEYWRKICPFVCPLGFSEGQKCPKKGKIVPEYGPELCPFCVISVSDAPKRTKPRQSMGEGVALLLEFGFSEAECGSQVQAKGQIVGQYSGANLPLFSPSAKRILNTRATAEVRSSIKDKYAPE